MAKRKTVAQLTKKYPKIRIDSLDKLFSKYIRIRATKRTGGCERCRAWKADYKQLQCAHLLGRWKGSIRWDEDNAIGACGGCHMVLDRDHTAKEEFIINHLGQERYDLLKMRARTIGRPDKELLTIYYTQRIKELLEE